MADRLTDEEKAKRIWKTFGHLERERNPYENMVDEVITYVNHSRRKIKDATGMKGKKTGIEVYDGTALSAVNLDTDGICGYSFSKSYRWFGYTLPGKLNFPRWSGMRAWSGKRMDEYPEVREWLQDTEEVLYAAYLRSNFYDISPEIVRDALTVGTVNPIAEEDRGRARTIFTVPHFRECYIAENRFGMVDTRYRKFKLTLRQLVDKFGIKQMDKVIPGFSNSYENNPYDEKEIIHAVYPRSDFDPNIMNSQNMPMASAWVNVSPLAFLYEKEKYESTVESGYHESPIMTWRWRKNNDEIYGRSPSWDAYVDIMKANQQGKDNLIAGHKKVYPPMMGPESLRGKINDKAKGWTFVDQMLMEKQYPRPLITGMDLPYAIDQQERSDKIIREYFYVDFFLMLSQAAANKVPLTATQTLEMAAEKAAILGTRIGRMESEFLNPVHDRMFAIEYRAGRIPQPPQILLDLGGNIEIDYLGPLAQAQKRIYQSQTIRAGFQSIGEASQVYEEVKLAIDPIGSMQDLLVAQGFPMKRLRSKEEITEILSQKHEMEDQQQTLEQGVEVAKAASRLTKPIEKGSPLSKIIGGEEGQA
jgi:hypothetical protein